MQDDEELVFRKSVGIGRLLQNSVETPAGTVLHHQDLVAGVGLAGGGEKVFTQQDSIAIAPTFDHTHLLLHSEQLDYVLVVEFLQDLELSHLDVERPQEAQVVEDFDGVQVACFLPGNTHKHTLVADIAESPLDLRVQTDSPTDQPRLMGNPTASPSEEF